MRLQTQKLRRWITGSPLLRLLPRRGEGLPGYWAVLFLRAVVQHTPPDTTTPCPYFSSRRSTERPLLPSGFPDPWASGVACFRGHLPTAHTLACLRFAGPVTETVARLATGWAGSPLAGRDSHPLGDKRSFMGSSHSSNSNRPAGPGRTGNSWMLTSASTQCVGCERCSRLHVQMIAFLPSLRIEPDRKSVV